MTPRSDVTRPVSRQSLADDKTSLQESLGDNMSDIESASAPPVPAERQQSFSLRYKGDARGDVTPRSVSVAVTPTEIQQQNVAALELV